ncbi:MAG: hypothetical protein ACSW72_06405, partial [Bacteroidales bacterium]
TPIRYSRYYYTEWYPDLERHLKEGWPVDRKPWLPSETPIAVAFTYEGYRTCYNTTPDLWERFEQVLHRKVRIPRRGDAKEGNMLSCTVSLSLRDCYEIGCRMNPEHK